MPLIQQTPISNLMANTSYKVSGNKVLIRLRNRVCDTADELFGSDLCLEIVRRSVQELLKRNSILLGIFSGREVNDEALRLLIQTLAFLAKMPADIVSKPAGAGQPFLKDRHLFNDFVEYLYNFWRKFERYIICDSEGDQLDQRPYRTFNDIVESLTHLVRKVYRNIQENVIQAHPRIYRQVSAGAEMAVIALPKDIPYPSGIYQELKAVPVIRQMLLYPPLVLNPPMNKRKGKFERISRNPLEIIEDFVKDEWLCYPAKVGDLVILIYFHEKFFELGLSLCNLFELADDQDLKRKPDALYLFGVPGNLLYEFGPLPTVFFDDEENDLLVGAAPNADEFGYFGYVKKMVLTLHNIKKIKKGRMPFHGALVKVYLKGNRQATLLMIGDSGAGKSETLEAFRELGEDYIQDLVVIADDMGSLEITEQDEIVGYGTETGAFLRLDDLQPGYALGQIDRAIIMSANQVNARIILPVTTFENVLRGQKIDYVLYANNYEMIDEEHPLIERFKTPEEAVKVFREGTVMSKGTTASTGLVHSYFANIFGPVQYKDLHEIVAQRYFEAFFRKGIFVGQMRTRLGIAGWERKGPGETAKELLRIIQSE